jgi:prevent-host-death family protein
VKHIHGFAVAVGITLCWAVIDIKTDSQGKKALILCIDMLSCYVYIIYVHFDTERTMLEINVKEARSRLSSLLNRVERGEEVIITRRGKKIARLVPTESHGRLPSLKDFRAEIDVSGQPISQTVVDQRDEERY